MTTEIPKQSPAPLKVGMLIYPGFTRLMIEYDPKPPFDTGHPGTAGPEMIARVHRSMGDGHIRSATGIAKTKRGARGDA